MKLYLESLGCAKNQVDSEIMLGQLRQAGWEITTDPGEAEAIVVNTCCFIESAAQESVDTIIELAQYKRTGACRRLVVAGCLPQRYRDKIVAAIPEADMFLGTGAFDQIAKAVLPSRNRRKLLLPDPNRPAAAEGDGARVLLTPHTAYLKVAEGCGRACTYCIIPKLRGRHHSRPLADLAAEARDLIASGVQELVLVAQDTTAYGTDLKPPTSLAALVKCLAEIAAAEKQGALSPWIRILYGHPESLEEGFVRTVAAYPHVCSYFDLPIQHASDRILKRMGRGYTREKLHRLFQRIRTLVPDAVLRTTVIVGFPGETETDFREVLDFVEEIRFDHLGVFVYSDAEDIPAHRLRGKVPPAAAQERYDQLMCCQMDIACEKNQRHIDTTQQVLIEEDLGNHMFAGRTAFQAPEVDGVTYVNTAASGRRPAIGRFVRARITDGMEYDLMGELA
jgi:ribosomal protein S12 methylthiotransferase